MLGKLDGRLAVEVAKAFVADQSVKHVLNPAYKFVRTTSPLHGRQGLLRLMARLLHWRATVNTVMKHMYQDSRMWHRVQGAHVRPPMVEPPATRARTAGRGARAQAVVLDPAAQRAATRLRAMKALFDASDQEKTQSPEAGTFVLRGRQLAAFRPASQMIELLRCMHTDHDIVESVGHLWKLQDNSFEVRWESPANRPINMYNRRACVAGDARLNPGGKLSIPHIKF